MDDRPQIDDFLSGHRIAIVGVSTDAHDFSRGVLSELVGHGYDVVPVHPGVDEIDGRKAYARVQDVPGIVDGALLMTPPSASAQVVHDCADAHIPRVWMHRGAGSGAVSDEAVAFCREHGIEVVAGRCPLMFLGHPTAFVHRLHAGVLKLSGNFPRGETATAAGPRERLLGLPLLFVVLELVCAVSAIFGGWSMIADPSGARLGLPPPSSWARFAFASYLVPGIVLVLANGIVPAVVAIGALARRPWARAGHILFGAILAGWMATQIALIGMVSPLQPLVLSVALALFVLAIAHARRAAA